MEDERGTGLDFYFMFCVRQSSVRGCRFYFVFVYFIIKVLNVRRFPPPSSRSTNCVTYIYIYIYIFKCILKC